MASLSTSRLRGVTYICCFIDRRNVVGIGAFDLLKGLEKTMGRLSAWMWFFSFVGWAITILLIKTIVGLWDGTYRPALWYFSISCVLFLFFFRRRIIVLMIIILTFLLATTGTTLPFHPSFPGMLTAAGSLGGLILLGWWINRRFPHLTSANWQTLFDRDPW
jgi:hypothetical protein